MLIFPFLDELLIFEVSRNVFQPLGFLIIINISVKYPSTFINWQYGLFLAELLQEAIILKTTFQRRYLLKREKWTHLGFLFIFFKHSLFQSLSLLISVFLGVKISLVTAVDCKVSLPRARGIGDGHAPRGKKRSVPK